MVDKIFKAQVLDCLPGGKDKAIKGKELAMLLRERDTRSIRIAIQELIADGYPICSSASEPAGYFIACTREEVNENLKVLKYGYGHQIFQHYKYLAHARDRMFPQLGLKI